MHTETNKKQREQLSTQSCVEETRSKENSSELIKREQVRNSPFTIITLDNKESFIAMGMERISPSYKTIQQARKHLETHKWEITCAMIINIIEKLKKYEKIDEVRAEQNIPKTGL